MAYAEKRGKGPTPWRARYKLPDGTWAHEPGFETKQEALDWGRDQESQIRHGTWFDPRAGEVLTKTWIVQWEDSQDVSLNTQVTRSSLLKNHILPRWGDIPLNAITLADVVAWEKALQNEKNLSARTVRDIRALLATILGDAVNAKPPIIPSNPAARPRNRGKKSGRKLLVSPPRAWATPLEALLIAERAALLSGRDDEFIMLIDIAYTGKRWGETLGLEREFLLGDTINLEWQLEEISGKFYRLPPKDDSYRSTNWEPFIPLDLPPFLAALLAQQANSMNGRRCQCADVHGGSGKYLYMTPEGGHEWRNTFSRFVMRPACDGRYPAIESDNRPERLVIVDTTEAWPGIPIARWLPAEPGKPFTPPTGTGTPRLENSSTRGRCAACGRSVSRRRDGLLKAHKAKAGPCPGGGFPPAEPPVLAAWVPVKLGLTPHDLRHSQKTWMIEDRIPEVLAEIRLGHEIGGIRGVYSHVSPQMREDLKAALQARWEESLRARAALSPHSAVPILDRLLAPYRGPQNGLKVISQISPSQAA